MALGHKWWCAITIIIKYCITLTNISWVYKLCDNEYISDNHIKVYAHSSIAVQEHVLRNKQKPLTRMTDIH